jgi:hypothetical protein
MPDDRVDSVAEKMMLKAVTALSGLEREMEVMKWPPEFRAIMWRTIAHLATLYAEDEREGTENRA